MTDNRQRPNLPVAALALCCVAMLAGCSGGSHVSDGWALSTPVLEPDVRFDGSAASTVALGATSNEIE